MPNVSHQRSKPPWSRSAPGAGRGTAQVRRSTRSSTLKPRPRARRWASQAATAASQGRRGRDCLSHGRLLTKPRRRDRQGDRAEHVDVDPQIGAGAVQAVMPEQVADGLDADAPAQQPHGEGVAQAVDVAPGAAGRLPRPLVEDVADAVVVMRPGRAAGPQEQLAGGGCRASLVQVAAQQAHRPVRQGQDQIRVCLALLDAQARPLQSIESSAGRRPRRGAGRNTPSGAG